MVFFFMNSYTMGIVENNFPISTLVRLWRAEVLIGKFLRNMKKKANEITVILTFDQSSSILIEVKQLHKTNMQPKPCQNRCICFGRSFVHRQTELKLQPLYHFAEVYAGTHPVTPGLQRYFVVILTFQLQSISIEVIQVQLPTFSLNRVKIGASVSAEVLFTERQS